MIFKQIYIRVRECGILVCYSVNHNLFILIIDICFNLFLFLFWIYVYNILDI